MMATFGYILGRLSFRILVLAPIKKQIRPCVMTKKKNLISPPPNTHIHPQQNMHLLLVQKSHNLALSNVFMYTPGRRKSKTSILSLNVDKKSLEMEFSNAICRQLGDKWQSKTLFLAIFDPCSSIVKSVFDCHIPGVM